MASDPGLPRKARQQLHSACLGLKTGFLLLEVQAGYLLPEIKAAFLQLVCLRLPVMPQVGFLPLRPLPGVLHQAGLLPALQQARVGFLPRLPRGPPVAAARLRVLKRQDR